MIAKRDLISEELNLLNNYSKFDQNLATPQLLTFFKSTNQADLHSQTTTVSKIVSRSSKMPQKSLYVGLKWLNFIHAALQAVKSCSLAQILMDLLPKVDNFIIKTKYEQYIMMKLVKPYMQYLGKLGRIVVQKLSESSPSIRGASQSLEMLYCEFNLLLFACEEFMGCSREFFGYFKQFYPCLNRYISLLLRDMYRIFRKIKLSSERSILHNISDLQIQMIQTRISAFGRLNAESKDVYGWLFSYTSGKSEEIKSPLSEQQNNTTEESEWGVAVSFFQS